VAVALGDPDAGVREEAVYALGKIGGPTAISLLRFALADQEAAVREAAVQILAELTGPLQDANRASAVAVSYDFPNA